MFGYVCVFFIFKNCFQLLARVVITIITIIRYNEN